MRAAGLFLFLTCGCVFGQHQHAPLADPKPVDLSKLPAPHMIEGVGHSHFAITTKAPEAQKWFDQGLSLLHCFWDYESLRAFQQAVRLDGDCAMCHWGVAQALEFDGREEQSKAELSKAKELSEKASDREQRVIRAFAAGKEKPGDEGAEAFSKEMAMLVERNPNDVEIRLMMAWHTRGGYEKGEPNTGVIYKQAMMRELLHDFPENAAVNHYWIHVVEASTHPEWALESAEKLSTLTPGSGHMVHMPGHIFYRVGDYEQARQSFLAAKRVDEEYMAREHVAVANDWNYAHNLAYLVADCAEEGRYIEAREHARSLQGLANDPDKSDNPWFYVLQIGSAEARLAIRFGNWDGVIERPMQFGVPDDKLSVWARGYRDGLVRYARGMKAAEGREGGSAKTESTELQALLWRLSQEQVDDKNKHARDQVVKILATASLELRGDIASAEGDLEAARKLLERADENEIEIGYYEPPQYSRPALEVLGAACLRAGKFSEAREAYQKALAKRPHSGFALYGIALAWDKQGEKVKAAQAYGEFLRAWPHADTDLPQMKAARDYLAAGANVSREGQT